ncbi:heavy metal-associated isoprenylated plant protein 6-like [Chenopodium quinoa]|uniref:heavy metal-associated isoprenylated plant protein 6-like n=1 Tax=Chenopodium quinoa TaxID=63459 RepID=UPI000B77D794|nr:heavy metal-associated isoprenylated plant protein 6-like [Chenopodium quinoa]
MEAWNRLRDIFQDNENSRAVALEQEFSTTLMEDFPNASSYCQRLKSLADQLKNVGALVSNSRMVLQLVGGLAKAYGGVGTLIRQSNPLPPFYKARSMLILEETSMAKEVAAESAMVASSYSNSPQNSENTGHSKGKNFGRKNNGGRRNPGGGGAGRSRGSGGGGKSGKGQQQSGGRGSLPQHQQQYSVPPYWQQPYGPWGWTNGAWTIPPCPYPNQGWARPQQQQQRASSPSILGPRPPNYQQAYATSQLGQSTPTDIEASMHTMSLAPPDPSWYMDTGDTTHMTSSSGNFSSYFNLSNHPNNGIVVGNGNNIPIVGYGTSSLPSPNPPLSLKNVLHAPKLIKNLISVRKFTTDNLVSVEFDPFGFSVKDFWTGMPIMRCNSQGDLYPITTTLNN